jgi:hypothetical protein
MLAAEHQIKRSPRRHEEHEGGTKKDIARNLQPAVSWPAQVDPLGELFFVFF